MIGRKTAAQVMLAASLAAATMFTEPQTANAAGSQCGECAQSWFCGQGGAEQYCMAMCEGYNPAEASCRESAECDGPEYLYLNCYGWAS